MNRRQFLKGLTAAGGFLCSSPFNLYLREAQGAPNLPALVVIFQRGGCDGLNTVVPFGDDEYYNLRPDIGITPPGTDSDSALNLDGFYGLHPSMSALLPMFQNNALAIMPTVQYPGYSRSHFSSQYYIESGVKADGMDGWLNRWLASSAAASSMPAVHFGGSLSQALRGNVPVASFSSINSFNLGLSGEEEGSLIDHVLPVYGQPANPPTPYRNLVRDFGQLLFGSLGVARSIDTSSYIPANGTAYPNTSYGRRLKEIAQLLKEPSVELQVATVDIGGWDTHSNQGGGEPEGRMSKRLKEFSDGIAALYTDLGALMGQVVILTMTEFGRTLKQNGSLGTDHGVASSWFAAGGGISGGIYDGPTGWNDLADTVLTGGRFLDYTINHRDIMGDILTGHLGSPNLGAVLPGHNYDPVGLFS